MVPVPREATRGVEQTWKSKKKTTAERKKLYGKKKRGRE